MNRTHRVLWVAEAPPAAELAAQALEAGLALDAVAASSIAPRLRDGEAPSGIWIRTDLPQRAIEQVRALRTQPYAGAIVVQVPRLEEQLASDLEHAGADEALEHAIPPTNAVTLVVAAIRHVRIRMERERALQELEGHHGALKERHEALRQAFRELAHELRTPLTSAREFLEILLEGEAGPLGRRQREFVEISRRSCTQMNERLENLMEIARFETGKAHGNFARASLSDVVRPLMQALAPAATRAGVRLQWKGDRLPPFAFDAQRISQALENLVGNALKFAPAGSKIEIEGAVSLEDPECLEIRVRDHGRGVDPEEAERLFERGEQRQREDATTRGGLGLGLAIAREIARMHGGDLRVEPTAGGGATFILTLSRTLGAVPPAVLSS